MITGVGRHTSPSAFAYWRVTNCGQKTSLSVAPEQMCGRGPWRIRLNRDHLEVTKAMRGRKNPPLEFGACPSRYPANVRSHGACVPGRLRVAALQNAQYGAAASGTPAGSFGGWPAEKITADSIRDYQLHRREQRAEAATINREASALSRMFQLAIRRGQLERMPLFPKRLDENPPRDGFFEHGEYLEVRAHLPPSYRDVLDFA